MGRGLKFLSNEEVIMNQGTNLGSQKGRWIILAALVAVLGALLFLLPGVQAQAQQAQQSFTYEENDTGPVATFSATDPEDVSPIVWSLLADATGEQDLGIFTDSDANGVDDSADDVGDEDIADVALFSISQSGVLTFNSPPDFEMPRDVALDPTNNTNTYRVVVQASDGGVGSFVNWFKVTVNVTDVEEPGTLAEWTVDADGDGTAQTPAMLLQFQPEATLTMANPTDSDGGVTNVRWQWYRTPNMTAPGTAIDGATAINYTVSDTSASNDVGYYIRVVATYSDSRGPNKTAEYVSINRVQAARDDNTAPEFALTTETRVIMENSTGNVGSPLTATDDDGDILTYSMATGGADNDSFTIDRATGQLMVGAAGLDFEIPVDTDTGGATAGDNIYVVTVKATDSHGIDSATVTVTITVTDVNEAPTFTGGIEGMAPDRREDSLDASTPPVVDLTISIYVATDPEEANVTLSLTGVDAAVFELAADTDAGAGASQVLSFKERPDFENPGDLNEDNIYEVTVQASDGVLTADRMMTIKVTDADEAGVVEVPQDALIGVELTATLTDSDTGAPNPAEFIDQVWTWYRLAAADTAIAADTTTVGTDSPSYTPVAADRGMFLRARVTYTDRTRDENNDAADNDAGNSFVGFSQMATSNATTAVRNNPANSAPVFAEGTSTIRLVEENTEALAGTADDDAAADNPADNVGGMPVVATDIDGDTVNYTLTGSDMFRVRSNGQIEVSDKADLDYETSRSHTVTLTADDGTGEANDSASITVTIHVTDLDEKPTITDMGDPAAVGEQTVRYAEEGTGPVIRLMARDPEGVTPIVWSLLDDATGDQDLGIVQVPEVADDVADTDIADRALFNISQEGVLTFASPPSFEGASASGDDNYQVVVQASDGGMVSHLNWFKVTVTVTDEPEGGAIAEWTVDADSDTSTTQPTDMLLQFNASATLTAGALTDGDGAPENVRWQWYRMSGSSGIGTAIDGATTEEYEVVDTPDDPNDVGKYLRVQATYSVGSGAYETASFVSINPVQATREAANTDPVFPATSVDRRITEDTTGNVGAPVRATDTDPGDILTYSISTGGDNDSFTIDRATGQLMVGAAGLDFENPVDTDTGGATAGDNVYVVTVSATDSSGGSATATVTITVTDVNEAPTFTGGIEGMAPDHPENTASLDIGRFAAADPEAGNVTLSLMGEDAGSFELAADTEAGNSVSQILSFKVRPDFENPGDRNEDNIYEVTVQASDGVLTADRMMTIKVTDADEAGVVEVPQDALIGVELTATLTDSDTGAPNPAEFIDQVWSWHRLVATTAVDAAAEAPTVASAIAGATSPSYTPVAADRGSFLKAMVTYTDRTRDEDNDPADNDAGNSFVGFMNDATSNATTAVRNNPVNSAPTFAEGTSTIRLVEENTEALTGAADDDAADDATADNPADNVGGGPVVATDIDEGQSVAYTLTGSDMFRVRDNGQIEVSDKADLDYETKNSYTVMLKATDTSGAANNNASIEVTIHVTDLDEPPEIFEGGLAIAGDSNVDYDENGTGAVGTYTAQGLEAASATWDLSGDDAGAFTVEGSGESVMLKFNSSPDFEAPADADGNNVYEVTLEAIDGTYPKDTHDVMVAVTNVDEEGTVTLSTMSPVVGNAVEAELTDPDGDISGMTWQWASAGDDGAYSDIEGETSASYTPDADDVGMTLRATATYDDGEGDGKSAMDVTDNAVVELEVTGDSSVTIEENVATVGTYTSSVSGAEWSLTGADMDAMSISSSGVLTFNTAPDYEAPADTDADNMYNVTVTATYGAVSDDLVVIVTVTDVEEGPVQMYDTNDDGAISISELFVAIDDYFDGGISIAELFEVIDAYFES